MTIDDMPGKMSYRRSTPNYLPESLIQSGGYGTRGAAQRQSALIDVPTTYPTYPGGPREQAGSLGRAPALPVVVGPAGKGIQLGRYRNQGIERRLLTIQGAADRLRRRGGH
jgi:hypothetical protein